VFAACPAPSAMDSIWRPCRSLPLVASRLLVFEIDRPGPQQWKRRRLVDLGLAIPSFLRFVPVDFEAGGAWWEQLAAAGFDHGRPAVVASTGVSIYLTKDAIAATLHQVAALVSGSAFVMSFLLPIEMADPEVRPGMERAMEGARANRTPFITFFMPTEILALARAAGFRDVRHVSAADLARRYFAGRTDGLRPPTIQKNCWGRRRKLTARLGGATLRKMHLVFDTADAPSWHAARAALLPRAHA